MLFDDEGLHYLIEFLHALVDLCHLFRHDLVDSHHDLFRDGCGDLLHLARALRLGNRLRGFLSSHPLPLRGLFRGGRGCLLSFGRALGLCGRLRGSLSSHLLWSLTHPFF